MQAHVLQDRIFLTVLCAIHLQRCRCLQRARMHSLLLHTLALLMGCCCCCWECQPSDPSVAGPRQRTATKEKRKTNVACPRHHLTFILPSSAPFLSFFLPPLTIFLAAGVYNGRRTAAAAGKSVRWCKEACRKENSAAVVLFSCVDLAMPLEPHPAGSLLNVPGCAGLFGYRMGHILCFTLQSR